MTLPESLQWPFLIGLFVVLYIMIGIGEGWLMRAIQTTIILAVVGSDIQWDWGQGGAPAVFGIGLAWLLTVPPMKLWDWYRYRFRRKTAIAPLSTEGDERYPDYSVPQTVQGHRDPEALKAELRRMVGMDKR